MDSNKTETVVSFHLLVFAPSDCSNVSEAGSPRIPRSPKAQRLGDSPSRDIFGRSPVSPTPSDPGSSSNPQPLSGVDGDIKQAFGDRETGRNLRDDLLLAADNVTSAMSSLVRELNSEDEDLMEDDAQFSNGSVHDTNLDALEQQVNQIRESLGAQEAESNSSDLPNGDFIMTEPSAKAISHGFNRGGRPLKMRAPRRAASEGDTDTDDDDSHTRASDFKGSSRTQMTDDESYIQTDDDEGTLRTDDEDMEWQESMKRLANR